MAFRNLIIQNAATLSLKNNQLVVHTDNDHTVAIEDISAIMIENRQSTITTAALSQLGQCGCTVFFCDEKHLPCAVLTPFNQHSRLLSIQQCQLSLTEPKKKRIWQSVVKQKIQNQYNCLVYAGYENKADYLLSLVDRVHSGDVSNVEATAAQYYFPALFGEGFARGLDNGINAGLNYGYAILRGCVARSLTVYGFNPAFGIHHKNALNAFNLADDLIEPYRPVIDLLVFKYIDSDDDLSATIKRTMFNCLNMDIMCAGQHHSVSYAIELTARSLGSAISENNDKVLLPQLLPMEQHTYE